MASPAKDAASFDDSDPESSIPSHPTRSPIDAEAFDSSLEQSIKLGDEFSSFLDVQAALKSYQEKKYCIFYTRDSVTIERAALRKGVTRNIDPSLKYYSLKFSCIHGGKSFKSKSLGVRSSSTNQKRCPAEIGFSVNKNGTKLVVQSITERHNHQCSAKLYRHLPRVRSLSKEEKKEVADLLALGVNKKKIKDRVSLQFGKEVLSKDLSNLQRRNSDKNNLQRTIDVLQNKFTAECHVLEDGSEFKGLFFATPEMKRSFQFFPEFVAIDGTFKLLNVRAPIYLIVVEDSEGNTEIVAVCILVTEDAPSVTWLLNTFKAVHPAWIRIKSFMADKDFSERQLIRDSFPSASVLICLFHALRTFNREITCEKFMISPIHLSVAKEYFQRMTDASTEAEYFTNYEKLNDLPSSIVIYFNDNWHKIRNEWTLTEDFIQRTFLNSNNNRIEYLNARVENVVNCHNTLEEFVDSFLVLVSSLNSARDYRAADSYQATYVDSFRTWSFEERFSNFLTQYAYDFVESELRKGGITEKDFKTGFNLVQIDRDKFEFELHGSRVCVTSHSCGCPLFATMSLPCRHIFTVRDRLQQLLFDESLCSQRWTRDYLIQAQRVFNDEEELVLYPEISSIAHKPRILSQHERSREALVIANELANLASEVTGAEYDARINVLKDLRNKWINSRSDSFTHH